MKTTLRNTLIFVLYRVGSFFEGLARYMDDKPDPDLPTPPQSPLTPEAQELLYEGEPSPVTLGNPPTPNNERVLRRNVRGL